MFNAMRDDLRGGFDHHLQHLFNKLKKNNKNCRGYCTKTRSLYSSIPSKFAEKKKVITVSVHETRYRLADTRLIESKVCSMVGELILEKIIF